MLGGNGDDMFMVYYVMVEVFLFGEDDDDSFVVCAFVKIDLNDFKKFFININGG